MYDQNHILNFYFNWSWNYDFYKFHVFFAFIRFVIYLSENDYLFLFFIYFVETDQEKWSLWNSFIRIDVSFFIIIYDFHVFCSYSSHLIRNSNHAFWIYHLMSLIESTKYESSLLSTVTDSSSDTCYFIRSCFENSSKLMWNVEYIFIFLNKLNSYV